MKTILFWLIFFAAFVAMIAGITQFLTVKKDIPVLVKAVEPAMVARATKEDILTKWLYNKCDRVSQKSARHIVQEAMKTSRPLLILALLTVESECNPTVISSTGAIGLGQIMWKHWGDDLKKNKIVTDKRDLFDVDTNIKATDYILTFCIITSNGDIAGALTRYLGANNSYYKNRITETMTNLYILAG